MIDFEQHYNNQEQKEQRYAAAREREQSRELDEKNRVRTDLIEQSAPYLLEAFSSNVPEDYTRVATEDGEHIGWKIAEGDKSSSDIYYLHDGRFFSKGKDKDDISRFINASDQFGGESYNIAKGLISNLNIYGKDKFDTIHLDYRLDKWDETEGKRMRSITPNHPVEISITRKVEVEKEKKSQERQAKLEEKERAFGRAIGKHMRGISKKILG